MTTDEPGNQLAGKWHLYGVGDDKDGLPSHRVDLVFHRVGDAFGGAILSRVTGTTREGKSIREGDEISPVTVEFDGSTLKLEMHAPQGLRWPSDDAPAPLLVLEPVGDHFEGQWSQVLPGAPSVRMQLVPAAGGAAVSPRRP